MVYGRKVLIIKIMIFIKYILDQLIKVEYKLEINDDFILIEVNGKRYKEKIFNPECRFDNREILFLSNFIAKDLNLNELVNSDFPILKCWYLITNEKYFKEEIVLDKYGRVGQSNLIPEFLDILKIPIADILKITLLKKLQIKADNSISVYLTCDFDILNIWDVWKFKDFLRESFLAARFINFKKFFATFYSYFFSRISSTANGFLNEKMYKYNHKFINLGFFISSPTNFKYDGKINYQNRVVKSYIERLKKNNVQFGLHTNFDTMIDANSIFKQQIDFENLFQQKTDLNRHHYLRFKFPEYLQTLEKVGIKKDFSIYFPESTLFRAGTCSSFYVWNCEEERQYEIEVIPTTLMDGTFSDYLFCEYDEALKLSKAKIDLALRYSNTVVLLWHNRSTYPFANIENNFHPKLIVELIDYLENRLN